MAIRGSPRRARAAPINFPSLVTGAISPYPTVEIVIVPGGPECEIPLVSSITLIFARYLIGLCDCRHYFQFV